MLVLVSFGNADVGVYVDVYAARVNALYRKLL